MAPIWSKLSDVVFQSDLVDLWWNIGVLGAWKVWETPVSIDRASPCQIDRDTPISWQEWYPIAWISFILCQIDRDTSIQEQECHRTVWILSNKPRRVQRLDLTFGTHQMDYVGVTSFHADARGTISFFRHREIEIISDWSVQTSHGVISCQIDRDKPPVK